MTRQLRANRLALLATLHACDEPRGRPVPPGGLTNEEPSCRTSHARDPRPRRHPERLSRRPCQAPDEWEPVPGALEAVARLNHAGWHAVVATNQSGHRPRHDRHGVGQRGAPAHDAAPGRGRRRLDAVFFCPHTPEDDCDCRKPQARLDASRSRSATASSLRTVPMVGDTLRDLQAAQAAGCEPHLVRTGRAAALDRQAGARGSSQQVPMTEVHGHLGGFVDFLLDGPTCPIESGWAALSRLHAAVMARAASRCCVRLLFLLWMVVTVVPIAPDGAAGIDRSARRAAVLDVHRLAAPGDLGRTLDLRRALPRAGHGEPAHRRQRRER